MRDFVIKSLFFEDVRIWVFRLFFPRALEDALLSYHQHRTFPQRDQDLQKNSSQAEETFHIQGEIPNLFSE